MKTGRDKRRYRALLTHRARLYGFLAIAAFIISVSNVLAIISAFWKPTLLLVSPLFMMFATVGLWACVNFMRTRSRLLLYRDHPDEMEDESVDLEA